MMDKIFTIGFTKKSAKTFFELLEDNDIEVLLDIRLNNTSQLAAFTKYPDIKYFLKEICNIEYIHDIAFAPDENTLKKFKKKLINWEQYIIEFTQTMSKRNINKYIKAHYIIEKRLCLLCSEATPNQCHRSLVANYFREILPVLTIVHL